MTAATATATNPARLWLNERNIAKGVIMLGDQRVIVEGLPMPSDPKAEEAIISALLVAGMTDSLEAQLRQIVLLKAEDFYVWTFGILFAAIRRMTEQGKAVDNITLADFLRQTKDKSGQSMLDQIGGEAMLSSLASQAHVNLEDYARIVREHAAHRQTVFELEALRNIVHSAKPSDLLAMLGSMRNLADSAQTRILSLHADNGVRLDESMPDHLMQIIAEQAHPQMVELFSTGFPSLDEYIHGWAKRRLYLVGGSNGMGKSAFLLSTGVAALRAGKRVCFVSLELSRQELLERIACNIASVDSKRMAKRQMLPDEQARLLPILAELDDLADAGAHMRLVCLPSKPTLDQFEAEIEKVYQTGGFDLLIIDYIGWGRFSENDPRLKNGNTVGFTGALFNRVDTFKMRYDCPVLVAVQINRAHEAQADKRPQLHHIADSKIGGDNADVVMFVHRPGRYDDAEAPEKGEMLIRKNRYGEEGTALIRAELQYNRFTPWSERRGIDRF